LTGGGQPLGLSRERRAVDAVGVQQAPVADRQRAALDPTAGALTGDGRELFRRARGQPAFCGRV